MAEPIKVNMLTIKNMVKASIAGLTARCMTVTGSTASNMGLELILILKDKLDLGNGKMVNVLSGSQNKMIEKRANDGSDDEYWRALHTEMRSE